MNTPNDQIYDFLNRNEAYNKIRNEVSNHIMIDNKRVDTAEEISHSIKDNIINGHNPEHIREDIEHLIKSYAKNYIKSLL